MTTKTRRRRGAYYIVPKIYHHPLHVHLWRGVDRRNRVRVHIGELAEWLGVSRDMARDHFAAMQQEGRLRRVKFTSEGGQVGIYEIADPFRYNANDPSTHARRHDTIQWG